MQMLGGKGGGVASMPNEPMSNSQPQPEPATAGADDFDDDIPF